MQAFVMDVSACMPWCCEDESTPASEEMLDWARDGSVLHVPALWTWEILNAVSVAVKRKRITTEHGRDFLVQLDSLKFRIAQPPQVSDLPRLHMLVSIHSLTAYDVAYLDLARRLSLPLATSDVDLLSAAKAEGIRTL